MKIAPEPDHLDARVPLGLLAVSIATLLLSALLALVVRWSAPASQAAQAATASGAEPSVAIASLTPATASPAAREGALPRPLAAGKPPGVPAAGLFERHESVLPTRGVPERLKGYGWVDRERRLVRIPIDRAKELYLAREAGVPQPVTPQEGWHER